MADADLFFKISTLPNHLKKEVEIFVDYLKSKFPVQEPTPLKKRKAGSLAGKITMKDNFDDPIDGLNDYQ